MPLCVDERMHRLGVTIGARSQKPARRGAYTAALMRPTLFGLGHSPWTERARWALDHHRMTYVYREHLPMLGEPLLRRRARTKKASVPLLLDGDDVVMGSFEIASHAERVGRGEALFPPGTEREVAHYLELGDRIAGVGRAWFMKRIATNRAAQIEAIPPWFPSFVRAPLAPTAAMAARFVARKYAVPVDVDALVASVLVPALDEIREALVGRELLLASRFSIADITIAPMMQLLRPREDMTLGPALREVWANETLAREYRDLVDWRDTIYRKYR